MKHLAVFLIVLFGALSFGGAQEKASPENQMILWSKDGNFSEWYFYTGNKFVAEIRNGTDEDRTVTTCLGKSFGKEKFSVIPEACGYFGREKGLGPQFWVLSETKKFSLSSYAQYARLRRDKSFGYYWFEGEAKTTKHFMPGLGFEIQREVHEPKEIDFGPSTELTFGRFVFQFFPLWTVSKNDRGELHIHTGLIYNF